MSDCLGLGNEGYGWVEPEIGTSLLGLLEGLPVW